MKKDLFLLILLMTIILDALSLLVVWVLMGLFSISTEWALLSLVATKMGLLIALFQPTKKKSKDLHE